MAHLTRALMWVLSRGQGDGVVRGHANVDAAKSAKPK